jgi:hypothetical protein
VITEFSYFRGNGWQFLYIASQKLDDIIESNDIICNSGRNRRNGWAGDWCI